MADDTEERPTTELGVPIEEAKLGNIAGGELEEQFADCMGQVVEAFGDLSRWQEKGKFVSCKVTMTAEFHQHLESGTTLCAVSAAFKPPGRKKHARQIFIRHGVPLVEAADQMELPELSDNVTPIDGTKET